MKLDTLTLPTELSAEQKSPKYRVTFSDRLELLKSKFMEKFVWGPEIPNAETEKRWHEAEDDIKNGRVMTFANIGEAIKWAETHDVEAEFK